MKLLITIIFLNCSLLAVAQSELSFDLLELEERYFYASDSAEKTNILLDKIDCHFSNGDFSNQLIKEAKRLPFDEISDSLTKANLLWNLALVSFINRDYAFADQVLFDYELHTHTQSITTELLKLQLYQQTDSLAFKKALDYLQQQDSSFTCLSCLDSLGKQEVVNERKMLRYSKIIPGWGTIKAGDTRSGLFSMLTHAGTIAGSVVLLRYGLYFNAVSWSVSLLPRFYSGNKILTQKAVRKKNGMAVSDFAKKCQEQTKLLLAKYPLELRN